MINRDMTTRYTDNDLLWMLANMTLERLDNVSNRDIIRERNMPTHHTYGNRFGSLAEAKERAGLTDNYTHFNYGEILKYFKSILEDQGHTVALDFPIKVDGGSEVHVPIYIDGVGSIDILPENAGRTIEAVSEFRKSQIPNVHHVLRSIKDLNKFAINNGLL